MLPDGWITPSTKWHVDPKGKFVIGGPDGNAGLTGRKTIINTYVGSAACAARYFAKIVVSVGLVDRCTTQFSYAIGVARPLSIYVDTHGTRKLPESEIEKVVAKVVYLSPRGIIEHLKLRRLKYQRTSAYGHFCRSREDDGGFSWERLDLVDAINKEIWVGF